MNYFLEVFKKYADFNGRARRAEYWYFSLFYTIILVVLIILALVLKSTLFALLYILFILGAIIPSIAVLVRRLHDTGKSGWMYFVSFIPMIGGIWLLVLLVSDSTPGDNQYGSNPKGVTAVTTPSDGNQEPQTPEQASTSQSVQSINPTTSEEEISIKEPKA